MNSKAAELNRLKTAIRELSTFKQELNDEVASIRRDEVDVAMKLSNERTLLKDLFQKMYSSKDESIRKLGARCIVAHQALKSDAEKMYILKTESLSLARQCATLKKQFTKIDGNRENHWVIPHRPGDLMLPKTVFNPGAPPRELDYIPCSMFQTTRPKPLRKLISRLPSISEDPLPPKSTPPVSSRERRNEPVIRKIAVPSKKTSFSVFGVKTANVVHTTAKPACKSNSTKAGASVPRLQFATKAAPTKKPTHAPTKPVASAPFKITRTKYPIKPSPTSNTVKKHPADVPSVATKRLYPVPSKITRVF